MSQKRKTIAVDFDGVIHAYTSPWTKPEEIHDEPVPGAIEWLAAARERFDVAIFSVRAQDPEGSRAIREWLTQRGVPVPLRAPLDLYVTATKPKAIAYIDDRGWRFEGTFPSLDEIAAFKPWNRRSGDEEAKASRAPQLQLNLSELERRVLWLSAYASAVALGHSRNVAIVAADRAVRWLEDVDASQVALARLPAWLRTQEG